MARAKSKSDKFNDDLLDDGVVRPHTEFAPEPSPEEINPHTDRDSRLAWLRAEIKKGLDDEAAGRFYEFTSVEEFMNHIKSSKFDDDDEAIESAADFAKSRP